MRLVLQRVSEASVSVDGETEGRIDRGLVSLIGIGQGDGPEDVDYLVDKTLNLRVFPDDDGKMNRSLIDIEGDLLVISQFTLYGNPHKGRRPSFNEAMGPKPARKLYTEYLEKLPDGRIGQVQSGQFGAMMDLNLTNDGPVTIIVDTDQS